MYKKFAFSVLLLFSTAGTAHAGFFSSVIHAVFNPIEQVAEWVLDKGGQVLVVTSCAVGAAAIDLAGGLDQLKANLPGMNDAESKVFIEYVDDRKEYFCNNPSRLIQIARDLNSALDSESARAAAIARMPEYTLGTDGDTIVDAFRHARVTAITTRILGDKWGLKLMEAHESGTDAVSGDHEWTAHQMDLHNNNVGYEVFRNLYARLGDREPSDDEIDADLRSRCFHYVDRNKDSSAFISEVAANRGLVYIVKANVPVEQRGVNCAVPRVNQALNFFPSEARIPNDKPVTISGTTSLAPAAGSISEYKWTFQYPVMFCSDATGCYSTTTVNASPSGEFTNTYPGKVYLMGREPMSVSLEAANAHGEWSNAATAWINNWGPMVPIMQLVLN